MGRVNDTVGTINTTLRTLLMLVLVGGAGVGGYKAYELYNEPRKQLADKQAELNEAISRADRAIADVEERNKRIVVLTDEVKNEREKRQQLEVKMKLLAVRRRLAHLTVIDQRQIDDAEKAQLASGESDDEASSNLITKIEFVEVNETGDPIGEPKQFDIIGDTVYVDYLRVTFDDKYIEESNLDRSTAIALFQRIFGEHQKAAEGFQIDTVGTRPTAYGRGTEMSDFERKIWDDFWLISNDRARAAELGIHAAHRTAVGQRVRPGMVYEIELRATGDMTIRPIDEKRAAVNEAPAPAQPPN
jgi:hypothetical protein